MGEADALAARIFAVFAVRYLKDAFKSMQFALKPFEAGCTV